MKRLIVIAALICAQDAFACAPDDYICQSGEKIERRQREEFLDAQKMIDDIHHTGDELQRYSDAREQSINQAQTNSLLMNLDRR